MAKRAKAFVKLCLFDFAEKVEVECGLALVESRAKKTTTAITKLRKG